VDYVIDILAAANFDPEFLRLTKRNSETIYNQLLYKQYNMSKSLTIFHASHENIEMDGIQKLVLHFITRLFIMTLALFNVSFLTKDLLAGSIVSIFTGIVVYANRTYLKQASRNKKQRCGTGTSPIEEIGLG
jgi:hypothetical protein